MGQWNTLHLFDDKKFEERVIPILKGLGNKLANYFDSEIAQRLLDFEYDKRSREERIAEIIDVSNKRTADFRQLPEFIEKAELINDYDKMWELVSDGMEDLNDIFPLVVFAECGLVSPYFQLGYRLTYHYLTFYTENTLAEKYINQIRQGVYGGLLGLDGFGIYNWLSNEDVKGLIACYDEIITNDYSAELLTFLTIADENGCGVVVAVDIDTGELNKIEHPPIGSNIDWASYGLKFLIFE